MEDVLTREFFASVCKTAEEKAILEMLMQGMSNDEIIDKLLQKRTGEDE